MSTAQKQAAQQEAEESEVATLTMTEASKRLGIGRMTGYELVRRGQFPGALKLGRRVVVSKRLLERFLDGESTKTE